LSGITTPGTKRDRALERGIQSPELRRAFKALRRAGWSYRMTGTTHIQIHNPQGDHTSISTTARGRVDNAIARLKQMGLDI
jgi:hypothetical protein